MTSLSSSLPERFGEDGLPWHEYRAKLEAAIVLSRTLNFPVGLSAAQLEVILKMADNWYNHADKPSVRIQDVLKDMGLTGTARVPEPPEIQEIKRPEDLMAPPKHMIKDIKAALQRSRDAKAARERAAAEAQAQSNGTGVPSPEAVSRANEA